MTVMCMQLLHSLGLTPQCRAFSSKWCTPVSEVC